MQNGRAWKVADLDQRATMPSVCFAHTMSVVIMMDDRRRQRLSKGRCYVDRQEEDVPATFDSPHRSAQLLFTSPPHHLVLRTNVV